MLGKDKKNGNTYNRQYAVKHIPSRAHVVSTIEVSYRELSLPTGMEA